MRFALAVVFAAGCAGAPSGSSDNDLFRDFRSDGKFDELGHPSNARQIDAAGVCPGLGHASGELCRGELPGSVQAGDLILNLRVRVSGASAGGVLDVDVLDGTDSLGHTTLDGGAVRPGWQNLSVPYHTYGGSPLTAVVTAQGNGTVEIEYFEIFPARFTLVLEPGSKELAPTDEITFETALDAQPILVRANGTDVSDRLAQATVETSSFRKLIHIAVGRLTDGISGDVVDLRVETGGEHARMQIRKSAPACLFEGDPNGVKILATGFQPFPADASHDNISRVALAAVRPSALPGVQLMRLELPVEYDRAAAEVISAIERCRPDVVVSFGQGGDDLHLEETAYNLKDTSEVSGGVPDNRGIIAAAEPILDGGDATRPTRLPLDAIEAALTGAGEHPVRSTDPGRYICNNVFYAGLGATDRPAGFIHLPYTTSFPAKTKSRWGRAVEAILKAAAR